jgi:uncharacterized repeat protein (TIGR04052 family)
MMLHRTSFVSAALVGLVVMAACGDDDDPPPQNNGGTAGRGGTAGSSGRGGSSGSAGSGGSSGTGAVAGSGGSAGMDGSVGSSGTAGSAGSAGSAGTAGSAGSAGSAGTSDAGDAAPDAASVCETLGSQCHPYDLGAGEGDAHECHEIGHAGNETTCAAERARCLAACSPGDAGGALPFQLKFAAKFGTEAFSCTGTYMGVGTDNATVKPVDMRFYVNNVKLITAGGTEAAVTLTQSAFQHPAGVALIDLEDGSGTCSGGTVETNAVIKGTVPKGIYTGVSFELGVPESLNHTDVSTAPSPVNVSGLYWGWLFGRIFLSSMIQGEVAADAGADAGPPVSNVHLGSTACSGTPQDGGPVTCAKQNRPKYTFTNFRFSRTLVFDIKALYAKSVARNTACHSFPGNEASCLWPFENLGVNYGTGSSTPTTQTVFKVE